VVQYDTVTVRSTKMALSAHRAACCLTDGMTALDRCLLWEQAELIGGSCSESYRTGTPSCFYSTGWLVVVAADNGGGVLCLWSGVLGEG